MLAGLCPPRGVGEGPYPAFPAFGEACIPWLVAPASIVQARRVSRAPHSPSASCLHLCPYLSFLGSDPRASPSGGPRGDPGEPRLSSHLKTLDALPPAQRPWPHEVSRSRVGETSMWRPWDFPAPAPSARCSPPDVCPAPGSPPGALGTELLSKRFSRPGFCCSGGSSSFQPTRDPQHLPIRVQVQSPDTQHSFLFRAARGLPQAGAHPPPEAHS